MTKEELQEAANDWIESQGGVTGEVFDDFSDTFIAGAEFGAAPYRSVLKKLLTEYALPASAVKMIMEVMK